MSEGKSSIRVYAVEHNIEGFKLPIKSTSSTRSERSGPRSALPFPILSAPICLQGLSSPLHFDDEGSDTYRLIFLSVSVEPRHS